MKPYFQEFGNGCAIASAEYMTIWKSGRTDRFKNFDFSKSEFWILSNNMPSAGYDFDTYFENLLFEIIADVQDGEISTDGKTQSAECPYCQAADGFAATGEFSLNREEVVRCSECGKFFKAIWTA